MLVSYRVCRAVCGCGVVYITLQCVAKVLRRLAQKERMSARCTYHCGEGVCEEAVCPLV